MIMNNPIAGREVARHRIKIQEIIVRRDQWQTCINCDHFRDNEETCMLFQAHPPAYIIANGCEDHTMKIPF